MASELVDAIEALDEAILSRGRRVVMATGLGRKVTHACYLLNLRDAGAS